MDRRGNTFVEYVLIISIVTAALFAMNIYVKRGLQGRVKDMSDYFISGNESLQEDTASARATTTSEAVTTSGSSVLTKDSTGGIREVESSEETGIKASSRTEDIKKNTLPDTTVTSGDAVVPGVGTENYEAAKAGQRNALNINDGY